MTIDDYDKLVKMHHESCTMLNNYYDGCLCGVKYIEYECPHGKIAVDVCSSEKVE